MAKRRAEDTVLHDSPYKRCYRSVCGVDPQLESMAAVGGVSLSPPSLLALLGSRCRKRPYYFEDPEKPEEPAAGLHHKTTHCDTRKHAAHVVTVQTSGCFQERRSSSTGHKRRPRGNCEGSEIVIPKANDKADADMNTEDCTYNSFQYWRVPLPELDLSLLEDASDCSQTKDKSDVKDISSDAMET
ncbi:uncharacterized protein C9orf40 homolog [Mastacembelus armatus]|uniref:uncharacterized protein C9orf40 homolog n=1 Tax=Mastacembelus armatus TaxID=205130 RepID=UPI000E45472B|nr:uncharacterized protein C9orf40 homolog [Mastacembelus armatus]